MDYYAGNLKQILMNMIIINGIVEYPRFEKGTIEKKI